MTDKSLREALEGRGWALETMELINKLTPDIKGKAFDPDWSLLRQRLEQMEAAWDAATYAASSIPAQGGQQHGYRVSTLVEALKRIRDEDDACQCECGEDQDCCVKVDVFCGHCIAANALGVAET